MKLNKKKSNVQEKALKSWLDADKKGTVEIITGLGKTFISLNALYTMPKDDKIHLFLAETTSRERDLMKDIEKYNKLFGRDVMKDYNLEFYCYQSAYKWKDDSFGLVIADEIHDSLTPKYSQFYANNTYDAIIGLSATVTKDTYYEEEKITKGDILQKIAPVCFTYGLEQAQQEGTSRKLNVYVILHHLDERKKNIQAGNKKKRFYQSEKAAYQYWDKQHKKSWYIKDDELKKLKIRITSTKRSRILYSLPSKIEVVKTLLQELEGKTIIFGNDLNSLYSITPNVISSKLTEKQNNEIRDAFEKDKINNIGSFKKLKQGANLSNLDNCIIMSYYSKEKDIIQRMGRLRQNGKEGNVFILLTSGTQEEVWFNKMFENLENINRIYCPDVNYAIKKYKKNENETN